MLSRRDLVGKLAAGAAAVCAVGAASTTLASTRRGMSTRSANGSGRPVAPSSAEPIAPAQIIAADTRVIDAGPATTRSAPQPWDLLHPLAMGSTVGHGWRVAGLTGVVDGSCVLTLENARGRTHRVHVCRNSGRPQGLVYTKRFDLVVMNGGQGDLPTEEGLAQAVAEVAHVLAANEGRWEHEPIVTALLPQAERLRLFSGSVDHRLR